LAVLFIGTHAHKVHTAIPSAKAMAPKSPTTAPSTNLRAIAVPTLLQTYNHQGSSTPVPSMTNGGATSQNNGIPIGLTLGITFGAVALIIFVAAMCFSCRRHKGVPARSEKKAHVEKDRKWKKLDHEAEPQQTMHVISTPVAATRGKGPAEGFEIVFIKKDVSEYTHNSVKRNWSFEKDSYLTNVEIDTDEAQLCTDSNNDATVSSYTASTAPNNNGNSSVTFHPVDPGSEHAYAAQPAPPTHSPTPSIQNVESNPSNTIEQSNQSNSLVDSPNYLQLVWSTHNNNNSPAPNQESPLQYSMSNVSDDTSTGKRPTSPVDLSDLVSVDTSLFVDDASVKSTATFRSLFTTKTTPDDEPGRIIGNTMHTKKDQHSKEYPFFAGMPGTRSPVIQPALHYAEDSDEDCNEPGQILSISRYRSRESTAPATSVGSYDV
jgi:hypothetical protein